MNIEKFINTQTKNIESLKHAHLKMSAYKCRPNNSNSVVWWHTCHTETHKSIFVCTVHISDSGEECDKRLKKNNKQI